MQSLFAPLVALRYVFAFVVRALYPGLSSDESGEK